MLFALDVRLTNFGLMLHDDKTRLVEFGAVRGTLASAGESGQAGSSTEGKRLTQA
ncbi:hypothetical protein X770_31645 [Mesorhizobium sp. LSJC269B00]|uniref:hypothetical protein n=1 Tax=Mesorhizobium sp. LSJC269B00 TaxID=1287326 RepID=UPI0003CE1F34|nr:hypothetical protein [Mesorhizobium sp. LSJC269B00]ESW79594.1 hypothetical protein X770_31645 [Mesorhizobium sp. LSJC269B00]